MYPALLDASLHLYKKVCPSVHPSVVHTFSINRKVKLSVSILRPKIILRGKISHSLIRLQRALALLTLLHSRVRSLACSLVHVPVGKWHCTNETHPSLRTHLLVESRPCWVVVILALSLSHQSAAFVPKQSSLRSGRRRDSLLVDDGVLSSKFSSTSASLFHFLIAELL